MEQENPTLKIKDLALLKSNPKQYYKTNKNNESWEQLEKPVRKITNNLIKINNKYNLGLKWNNT